MPASQSPDGDCFLEAGGWRASTNKCWSASLAVLVISDSCKATWRLPKLVYFTSILSASMSFHKEPAHPSFSTGKAPIDRLRIRRLKKRVSSNYQFIVCTSSRTTCAISVKEVQMSSLCVVAVQTESCDLILAAQSLVIVPQAT